MFVEDDRLLLIGRTDQSMEFKMDTAVIDVNKTVIHQVMVGVVRRLSLL